MSYNYDQRMYIYIKVSSYNFIQSLETKIKYHRIFLRILSEKKKKFKLIFYKEMQNLKDKNFIPTLYDEIRKPC
jgi:hypothetical protein